MGFLQVAAMMVLLLGILAWMGAVLASPLLNKPKSLRPKVRMIQARTLLYAPLWLPGLLLAASLLVSTWQNLRQQKDHCLQSLHHHVHHLCWFHPPDASNHWLGWVLPILVGVFASVFLGFFCRRMRDIHHLTNNLRWASTQHQNPSVWILNQKNPIAFTSGVWKAHIFISKGLLALFPSETVAAILAHETGHLKRRDTFWGVFDQTMARFYPWKVRHTFLQHIGLARETACDEYASKKVGCRFQVAKALTQMARYHLEHPPNSLAFGTPDITTRVSCLMDPPKRHPLWLLSCLGASLVLFFFASGPGHHLVELWISQLLH